MPIETVKGFRDILPPQSIKRKRIMQIIEKNMKIFGFVPVETPIIEYAEVARGDNEKDSAVSEMFKLKDRGERELALRYEFTFQQKRMFKENPNIKLPLRKYQMGQVFRDEPIGKDRYREFIQCDVDILGDESIKADVECLALADRIFKELNIDYELVINNRKLLNAIVEKSEISNIAQACREIDKIDKIGEKEARINLAKIASKEQIDELFQILGKDFDYYLKEGLAGAAEAKELMDLCKTYKINAKFSPFLVRGFSYYTGNVFEAYNPKIKGSLCAGGRYDNSVGTYLNRKIPAVGISFGRLVDFPDVEAESMRCLLISIGQEEKTIELMNELRDNDISCMMMSKISKGLDYANAYGIPFVIMLGEDEVKKKKVKLKNMKSGKEELLSIKEIVKELKNE